ncbi:MAG: ABC transporter ATP-binding protein [Akkermansiaceae bacterium]|nr:ABC transporter ATP-binding protein [Akkermansiaceae bacterium]
MIPSTDSLVKVDKASKKYCRNLKKSLWYGMRDVASELLPIRSSRSKAENSAGSLRPGEFWANKDISFELRRGECLGLIGHNGAGKTTLLKMLNGLIKPDSGSIEIRGRVGALIALGAGFSPVLTGRENIYVNASILGLSKAETDAKLQDILDFADIGEFVDAPVQSYSSGMAVRLGFAVASALSPDILLLDEVLAVGDVAFQAKCFNKLADMRREGVPFILVSHNMHQIARYCDKVIFMKKGQIEFAGDAEEGISRFLADMNQSAHTDSKGPDWSVVNGSGKVVFTAARFLDKKGNQIESIQAGQPLTFEVSFECRETPVVDPVLDVVIRCSGETVFQATNRSANQPLGSLPPRGKLLLRFDSIPMNSAPLDFYFCLLDGVSRELFDWKRDLRLPVIADSSQTGTIRLKPKWSIDHRPESLI